MTYLSRKETVVMRFIICVLFFTISCNDAVSNTLCASSQNQQTGFYTMVTQEKSGDCGSMGTLQVNVEDGAVSIDESFGCGLEGVAWSEQACTTLSVLVCDDGTWEMILDWEIFSNSQDSSKLTGVLYADMAKWGGLYTCASEYTFEATKVQ